MMTAQDLTRSETRLGAKIDKAVSEFTWRMLGGMAGLVAIVAAIVKPA